MNRPAEVTDLGPASCTSSIGDAVALGDRVYLTTRGTDPTRVVEYDPGAGRVTRTFDLPTGDGSWSIVAIGGALFAGTHVPGDVYRVDPRAPRGDRAVTRALSASVDDFIWSMAATPDGHLVVGTSPGCRLAVCEPGTGAIADIDLGDLGLQYVRAVVADDREIYAGLGMPAELVRVDRATGARDRLLPASLADRTLVYSLAMDDRRVVGGVSPYGELVVVDRAGSRDTARVIPLPGPGDSYISAIALHGGSAIVAARPSGAWYDVDLLAEVVRPLGAPLPGAATFAFRLRGGGIAGFLGEGVIARLDPGARRFSNLDLADRGLEPRAELPMSMAAADGRVLVGGKGGVQIHDLATGRSTRIRVPGEPKVIGATGDPMVFGVYDPAQLGVLRHGGREVTVIGDIGHEQTRPQGIAVDVARHVALITTQPDIGRREGAVTVVHLDSARIEVHRGVIADQSLYGVDIADGIAYVGGDVQPGYGLEPTEDTAALAAIELAGFEARWTCRPARGAGRITGICVVNGIVHCLTGDGRLCLVDPASGQVWSVVRVGDRGGDLVADRGIVYGTTGDAVFRLSGSPRSPQVTTVADGLAADWYADPRLVRGSDGALYTVRGRELVRIGIAAD